MKAKPSAKNIIPSAEIAVSERLTDGFASTTDELCTAKIIEVYQVVDTKDCVQESTMMPIPRETLFGTNCGMNATAKSAAFTLVKFVNNPRRNAGQNCVLAELSKSNFPNSFFN